MKQLKNAGFTIIETMLFLGITGLLVMGILVGTGNSINIQRYRDSVTSLQSFLQQQYSEVANVTNNRGLDRTCGDAGIGLLSINSSNPPRGQSECVILGRLITTSTDKSLMVKVVAGHIPASTTPALNDLQAIGDYNIDVLPESKTYDIDWGSSLVKQNSNDAMTFSILIVRSPLSGVIRTFISNDAIPDLGDADSIRSSVRGLINSPISEIKMCVNSNGLFNGTKMAIQILNTATSASGVETLGDASSGC